MARIACLWVPDLCLWAHLRVDPKLAGVPLVLTDGRAARSAIVATSTAVAEAGVVPGMTATEARALCAAVVVRPVASEALTAALATLADVAATLSARVEIDDRDRVFLDCEGSALLWASESELATALGARAARCGLPAWVGIADSRLGAAVAARASGGIRIVPSGHTPAFLAALPVAVLDPDPESAATLASWGIRFVAELAALPPGAVAHRLGSAGTKLVRRARGEDDAPLRGRGVPRTFTESLALDYGVDRLEPLVFVLRRLIECVTSRIELHGLGCRALELGFDLEGGGRDLRTLAAAAPTTEHKILLTLVRTHLESHPPSHPVTKIVVAGVAARIQPTQLDFLRPSGPAPAALASTLARLAVLCGSDRVGVLRRADSHRPDAVEVVRFEGKAVTNQACNSHQVHVARAPSVRQIGPNGAPSDAGDGLTLRASRSEARVRPEMACDWRSQQGSGENCGLAGSRYERALVRMALRAFRPPVPLEVRERAGSLDYVQGERFGGRVVHRAGPWRLRGEWWTADPYVRDYYDVELADGGVYRIYRDVRKRCWWADGMYD